MHDNHQSHHGHLHEDHSQQHEHHSHGHAEPSHPHQDHPHDHDPAVKSTDEAMETAKLRKIVEHWIGHNEDHANSYRLWADRAKDAGYPQAGELLEQIASEVNLQNDKFAKIIQIIDSSR
jgi:hypothetical protein